MEALTCLGTSERRMNQSKKVMMFCDNEESSSNTLIMQLPEDVLLNIFSFLHNSELYFTIRNVCTTWKKISENSFLWKLFDIDKEYCNVSKKNVNTLSQLRNWIRGISPFLLKLIVYKEYHKEVSGGVKGTMTTFPKLQTLDITYGESRDDHLITVDIMEKIFPNLRELRIQCFGILPESVLDKLHTLHKLEKIRFIYDCHACWMEQYKKEKLNNYLQNLFKNLQNVIEIEANILSNVMVATVLQHCRRLEILSLAGCTEITGDAFKEMPFKETLLTLNVNKSNIDDSCLEMILKKSPNLRYISVKECFQITDLGLSYIGKYSQHLETLIIEEDEYVDEEGLKIEKDITDVGIESVARGCINLKALCVNYQEKITDSSLKSLSDHCPKLSKVEMSGYSFTDIGLEILSKGCSSLRYVEFSECSKLTHKSVEYLAKNCPHLKEVKFIDCNLINRDQKSDYFKNLYVIL